MNFFVFVVVLFGGVLFGSTHSARCVLVVVDALEVGETRVGLSWLVALFTPINDVIMGRRTILSHTPLLIVD